MPKLLKPLSQLVFVEPSAVARRLLWHIFSLGTRRIVQPDHHEPFEKPGAHLFWVQSGQGFLEQENRRFALARGHKVWVVDMSKPRTYLAGPRGQLTFTGFRFSGPGLDLWHEELRSISNTEFVMKDFRVVQQTYRELLRMMRRKPTGWEWQVHVLITQLLGRLLISRGLLVSPLAELPPPVLRALNCLDANPSRAWKAEELATAARVSYSVLRGLFNQSGQGTIHENINRVRLDHARLLLADQRLSIKDVAAQLNFSNEFYFSHFFRHHAHMSPSEFRRHLKG